MTPEQWEQVQAAFAEAIELAPEARHRHLERSGADPLVRREVAALIAAADATGRFMDAPLPPLDLADVQAADLAPGAVIGRYRIVREIGMGGMGRVYLAARDDGAFQQSVAIKVVKLGLAGADAVQRFQRERQVLAQLRHPGIARLIDGGTMPDGRPYLVMEHVEGQAIDAWCDDRRASIRARLELFVGVCAAVQHAHRSLVVHRDLKPSNILVTADGAPHLLDFGIAKVLRPDAGGVEVTGAGERAMTPRYASPEQIRGGAISTVTDVYALGVILSELLTGRAPFELAATTSAYELERAICEADRARPSSMVACSPEIESIARARSCDGRALVRGLRGDLDVIVLKAIAREPERRYASVEALADDVKRHLRGEPVAARPDSWRYRTSKFVGRHPVGVGLAAVATIAIVAASIASMTFAFRAEAERVRADRRAEDAEWSAYTATLAAASEALNEHWTTVAKRRLEGVPERLRGWEWEHLWARLDQSEGWLSVTPRVHALDVSDDGALVAAGGTLGVTVFDGGTRVVLQQFPSKAEVVRLAFLPGGGGLVWTAGGDLWRADLATGSVERHHRDPAGVEFVTVRAPLLLLGLGDGRLCALDLATRERLFASEPVRAGALKAMAISPDGTVVAAAGAEGVHLWRTADWSSPGVLRGALGGPMEMCFSPDGRTLAVGDSAGTVRLWDVERREAIGFPVPVPGEAWGLAFAPDGRELAIAGRQSVHYLDVASGLVTDVAHVLSWPTRLRYLEGETIVMACYDGVRSLSRRAAEVPVLRLGSAVSGAGFAPDGARILANGSVWNVAARSVVTPGESRATSYRFDRAGERYVLARGIVAVCAANDSSVIAHVEHGERRRWYWTADMHPDGTLVAAAGRNGEQIELRHASTLELARALTAGEKAWTHDVRFSPDGRRLATVTHGAGLRIWDVETGMLLAHPEPRAGIDRAVAWSADGATVAAGGTGADAVVWETGGWSIVDRLPRRASIVSDIAFHPTAPRVATADDREVRIWDTTGRGEVLTLRGHVGVIGCLDWSPDGTMLLSGSQDRTIRIWSAQRSGAAGQVLLVDSADEGPADGAVPSEAP